MASPHRSAGCAPIPIQRGARPFQYSEPPELFFESVIQIIITARLTVDAGWGEAPRHNQPCVLFARELAVDSGGTPSPQRPHAEAAEENVEMHSPGPATPEQNCGGGDVCISACSSAGRDSEAGLVVRVRVRV